jgi:hypothetical protein
MKSVIKRNLYLFFFKVRGIEGERFTSTLDYKFIPEKISSTEIYNAMLAQASFAMEEITGLECKFSDIDIDSVCVIDSSFIASKVSENSSGDFHLDGAS